MYQIYFSPTHSTEQMVETVGAVFGGCEKIDLSDRAAVTDRVFAEGDLCIVGVPSYGGRVPAVALERMAAYQGNGAAAVLLVSYGNRAYEDTLKELQNFLRGKGFSCIAAIAAVAEHSIMHQFAAGRPDAQDKAELTAFAKKIKARREEAPENEVSVPGNDSYKEYKGVPLKPKAGKSCTECGACAKGCPVGAIPQSNPKTTEEAKCISCMRCVEICPVHARTVSELKRKVASAALSKVCSVRKENELFL